MAAVVEADAWLSVAFEADLPLSELEVELEAEVLEEVVEDADDEEEVEDEDFEDDDAAEPEEELEEEEEDEDEDAPEEDFALCAAGALDSVGDADRAFGRPWTGAKTTSTATRTASTVYAVWRAVFTVHCTGGRARISPPLCPDADVGRATLRRDLDLEALARAQRNAELRAGAAVAHRRGGAHGQICTTVCG